MLQENAYSVADAFSALVPAPDDAAAMTGWVELTSKQRAAPPLTTFAELGLSPKVLAAVEAAGYTAPTPIQAGAIPPALERKDVLGIAQTGTGKTASFVLPMLTLLEKGRARARMPRTLILEPTRELAAQVECCSAHRRCFL
jgi:superfamily II DNA/RNA helicase